MPPQYGKETIQQLAGSGARILPRYGFSADSTLSLLTVSENATFLATDPRAGRRAILRIHRLDYHSKAHIASELAWIDALHRDGNVHTAPPLADRDGERIQTLQAPGQPSRFAVMFPFLSGKEPAAADDLRPWFEILGETTARLHQHALHWQPPQDFIRQTWTTDAMHGERALWGPWRAAPGLTQEGAGTLAEAVALIAERTKAYGTDPTRFGLIHADLRLANLLVDGATLKLIDFDDCGFCWLMYDFAAAISFIEHTDIIPGLLRAWLLGYKRLRPLEAADIAIIPTLVMARRILLTAWLASHSETDLAQHLGPTYPAQSVALAKSYLAENFLAAASSS